VRKAGTFPGCRILYLAGELHKGGLERQLYYLLRTVDRERYKPAVAVWNYRERDLHVPLLRALGVPIYPLSNASSRIAKLEAFRQLVKALAPEVIHSYAFYTNFAASWGACGTNAVPVGSVRSAFGYGKKGSGPLLGRLSARWPGYQIFNSFAAAEEVRRSRGFFLPRQLEVVPNGRDLARFPRLESARDGPAQISGLGYLLPVKRWDRLLRSAHELKRRGLVYKIRIVGDGPLRHSLEQQARQLDVADRVELLPHTDSIPGLFAQTSFLAHTADSEGCPNSVMEAMACGRAVVATAAGDVPRLIADGKTGFVVPIGDEALFAERMATLITDRALCRRMGEAARIKAERDFGLDRLVAETLAAYHKAGWKSELEEPGIALETHAGGERQVFANQK
jgi:glycosyltransferase involved in cell wall biosynthesis